MFLSSGEKVWMQKLIAFTVCGNSYSQSLENLCQHRSNMVDSSGISHVICSMESNWLPQGEPMGWVSYVGTVQYYPFRVETVLLVWVNISVRFCSTNFDLSCPLTLLHYLLIYYFIVFY